MKKTIRRLGLGETWLALLHDRTAGTAQTVLIADINGSIDKIQFENAIQFLLNRYPQLGYTLELNDDGYYLTYDELTASKINVSFEETDQENSWMSVAQEEANTHLHANQVLFRARCLRLNTIDNRFFIILTIHHAISDGLSLPALLDALLYYFNHPQNAGETHLNPGPIEELYTPTMQTQNIESSVMHDLEQLNKIQLYRWPHQVKSSLNMRITHFLYCFLKPTELKKLHQAAKNSELTINGVFNAAMLLSAQKLLKQSFNAGLSTPVGLRNQTNGRANQYDVGFLLQVIDTVHPNINEKTDLITLAKEYNKQLKRKLALLQAQKTYDFHEVEKSMSELWNPLRDYFCYNFMVTNLGLLKFENESARYRVNAMRFITCRKAADNNMMLYINSTDEGCFYTFGYPYPSITHEWAKSFVHIFNDFLKDAANG